MRLPTLFATLALATSAFAGPMSNAELAAHTLFVGTDGLPMTTPPLGMPAAPSPEALAESFRKSGSDTLLIYFHGGLVDAESGLMQSRHLEEHVFRGTGAFTLNVVWNSGWGDVVESLRSRPGMFQNMFAPGHRPNEVRLPYLEAIRRTRHYVDAVRRDGRTPENVEAELRDYYRRNVRDLQEEDIQALAAGLKGWASEAIGWSRTNPLVGPRTPDVRAMDLQYGFLIRSAWDEMKRSIERSCDVSWGAANRLIRALGPNPPKRIVMVGHSAGSIYATRFLRRAAPRLPETGFDALYLEPAISYRDMAEAAPEYRARVGHLRMFGMDDPTARTSPVLHELGVVQALDRRIGGRLGRLYPGSLLYMVSNMLEGDADTPVLGLQRFREPDLPLTESERADRATVDSFIDWPRDAAWSPGLKGEVDPRPGYATRATAHGGIWREPVTNASMVETLRQWQTPNPHVH